MHGKSGTPPGISTAVMESPLHISLLAQYLGQMALEYASPAVAGHVRLGSRCGLILLYLDSVYPSNEPRRRLSVWMRHG